MSTNRPGAARAIFAGIRSTVTAPGLLLALALITIVSAIPFALVVDSAVMQSLAVQPPPPAISGSEIDAEWWLEFRRQATGLAATFTPAILGFAAPMDSISGLLDSSRRPAALVLPIALSAILWAFLWGGILHRFASRDTSWRTFLATGARHMPMVLALTVAAAAVNLLIYFTLHPLLFDVVYAAIAARMPSEATAFAVRVVCYVVFGAVLIVTNALFAFARIEVVCGTERALGRAVGNAWSFIRANVGTVAMLYLAFIAVVAAALSVYGAAELIGGSRVGGWRAVVIGQAFVVFRLAVRLMLAGAQVSAAGRTRF